MKIGILGSGRMGGTLGTLFARAGHQVTFSYARSDAKLRGLAQAAGTNARAGTEVEAARDADAILLAVHWSQLDDVLQKAGNLAAKTILTCCVPLNLSDTELVVAHSQSGAEVIAAKLPSANVVAAFQTTPSEVLFKVYDNRAGALRPSMIYCGNERTSMTRARGLISDIGFDPVNAGPLRIARYAEPFAMLTAQLAYGTDQGPEWGYRFGAFESLIRD